MRDIGKARAIGVLVCLAFRGMVRSGVAILAVLVATSLYAGGCVDPMPPQIVLTPTSQGFTTTQGGANPANQTVAVTNGGSETLSGLGVGSVTYGSDSGWLQATLSETTAPATLTLQVTLGSLDPGVYTATVPVQAAGAANSPQEVTVTFTVSPPPPQIVLTPTSRGFTTTQGGASPANQTVGVTNGGGGTLRGLGVGSVTYNGASGWLQATLSETTAPATLTLQVTLGSLEPGVYRATVQVQATDAANSPQSLSVTVLVLPQRLEGVDYGPFRDGQRPGGPNPTLRELESDIPILKAMANCLRTYSVTNGLEQIVTFAEQQGLCAVPTAWIDTIPSLPANDSEVQGLIAIANQRLNVPFVIVGSEVVLRKAPFKPNLLRYMKDVRNALGASVQVTTAEPWHIWRDHPDLASEVDLILINVFPYWEQQPIESAVAYVVQRYGEIKALYPDKRVVISETGWPSDGLPNGTAIPSVENQRRFITEFLVAALAEGMEFFFFEAFDEAWKTDEPNDVGIHWGFYDSKRQPKHGVITLR